MIIGLWCNGSTEDFESFSQSSNLCSPAKFMEVCQSGLLI